MQPSKFLTPMKLAALGAAVALSSVAFATNNSAAGSSAAPADNSATATAPAAQAKSSDLRKGGKWSRGHHHVRDTALWVPGFGPLKSSVVESLALNDNQKQLLDQARAEQKSLREGRRGAMKDMRTARAEQLKSGKIDPHAAVKAVEDARQSALASRRNIDEKWLAVWDSLDAGQQQKVVASLNDRAEKFAQKSEQRKARHAEKAAKGAAPAKAAS
jgi:hypothetical protein